MPTLALSDLAKKMKDIDIAMLVTTSRRGHLAARPMSNNRDVAYEGTSHFFTYEDSQTVKDIEKEPLVNLSMQGKKGLYISISGKAKLLRSRKAFVEHWVPDLDEWFEQGVDTPGLVLIRVEAKHATMWEGKDEKELAL